jgi:hypothetical protein
MTENLMTYAQARKEFGEHAVRRAEVPVEYTISLPMPTKRWTEPGYAGFACPAIRRPHQPLQLRRPDRWWLLGARHGELLVYGRTSALPFSVAVADSDESVVLPPSTRSVGTVLEDLRVLDETMEQATGPFFAGEPADATLCADLREIIRAQVQAQELLDWYWALTPDFFSWLDL